MDRLQALAKRFRDKQGGGGAAAPSHRREAPGEKRKVARLPYEEVRDALTRHPLVTTWALDAKRVFTCMVEQLAMLEGAQRPTRDTSWAAPKDAAGAPSECCPADGVLVATSDAYVCSACGACSGGRRIDLGDPYRYFAEDRYDGKSNPTHWSGVHKDEWGNERDEWDEAEQMMTVAFGGRACPGQLADVVALLRAYRSAYEHIAHRTAASAAAWILIENPDLKTDHSVRERAPPVAPFACARCPERFFVRRDLRVHRCSVSVSRKPRPY
jgi:hypothetical protein